MATVAESPILEARQLTKVVRRHHGAGGRRFPPRSRARARAHRRERRRQVDAAQDSRRHRAADRRYAAARRAGDAVRVGERRQRARHQHHPSGTAALPGSDRRREPVCRPREADTVGYRSIRRTGVLRASGPRDTRSEHIAARAARRVAARTAADRRDREGARARYARAADGRADLGAERCRGSAALPGHPRPHAARRVGRLYLAPARGAARDRRSADRPARRSRGRRVVCRGRRCVLDCPADDRPRRRRESDRN